MASSNTLNVATALPTTSSSATTTLTVTATPASSTAQQPHHAFTEINRPFQLALSDSEERNWCFHKGDIAIEKFTSAITAFLTIFDAIGSAVITEIVRKDFRWKTNGLKNASKRLRVDNVRELVRKELKSPPRFWSPSGIESLLWAHRILRFVEHLVDYLSQDPALELRDAGQKAYRDTLAPRHPPMSKVIFEKALNLLPPRSKFIANLTECEAPTDADRARCLVGMKEFLRSTRPFIEALTTLFDMEQIDDDDYR